MISLWFVPVSECTTDWQCTDWGECVDDVKTRTCTDANSCGTDTGKPEESKECGATAVKSIGKKVAIVIAIIVIIAAVIILIYLFYKKQKSKKGY